MNWGSQDTPSYDITVPASPFPQAPPWPRRGLLISPSTTAMSLNPSCWELSDCGALGSDVLPLAVLPLASTESPGSTQLQPRLDLPGADVGCAAAWQCALVSPLTSGVKVLQLRLDYGPSARVAVRSTQHSERRRAHPQVL